MNPDQLASGSGREPSRRPLAAILGNGVWRHFEGWAAAVRRDAPKATTGRDVFVIHGRDEELRQRVFELLREVDLRPLEWEMAVAATGKTVPTLLDVVKTALSRAQATVVILTPDDTVALHPELYLPQEMDGDRSVSMQPRPNVLLELGMALALQPERTIILEAGDIRHMADLGGLNVIRLNETDATIGKIVQRLKTAGCDVNDVGGDWRRAMRFKDLAAYGRTPPPTL
ncbi:MAG: nucleotide-binding protein [Micromonosporaceae bacterium]|nr:nucleotide-binding protein [Micromonosporaceae bacterium]